MDSRPYNPPFITIDTYEWEKYLRNYPEAKKSEITIEKSYTDEKYKTSIEICFDCVALKKIEEEEQSLKFIEQKLSVEADSIYSFSNQSFLNFSCNF